MKNNNHDHEEHILIKEFKTSFYFYLGGFTLIYNYGDQHFTTSNTQADNTKHQ
jgi:hypothetical protein